MLKIYNTLARRKEKFEPIETGKVSMYVCGMTVYDYCHIGHARVMVVFDVVARYLRSLDYQLTYVRNVTDIDDKIIARAKEADEPFEELTARYIDAMHEDETALNVTPPDIEPHATQSISDIIDMIATLIEKDYAYIGKNGDVFYAVAKFAEYGSLSGKNLDELKAGERVGVNTAKKDPLDFVLWKMAKPGEPAWESPWGEGRPGWHIECSAMSTRCLGEQFDIHGGGMDLQFPHHENEIAQSQGATGKKFVNLWMHNGFVRINEEKMSKSLGNFFTVREVLKRYRAEVIRFFIVNSHYRSPLNYSDENLNEADAALTRLYTALRDLSTDNPDGVGSVYDERFHAAMQDDFNTPMALSVMFDLAREINRQKSVDLALAGQLAQRLKSLGGILGILQDDPDVFLKSSGSRQSDGLSDQQIGDLIDERLTAKRNKDWETADRIRNDLKQQGIVLEDVGDETTWRRE